MTPLPIMVWTTGMCRRSAMERTASLASPRTAPAPARMIGLLASEMSLAASMTLAGSA